MLFDDSQSRPDSDERPIPEVPTEESTDTADSNGVPRHVQTPTVYLSGARGEWSLHPGDILVRTFMLHTHGYDAATGSVRYELRMCAWLLFVVTLFEWCAWFLVLNTLAHSRAAEFSGFESWLALAGAALIASAVFVLERAIMVSDIDGEGWKKWIRVTSRVLLIFASAFITMLPVELIGFRTTLDKALFRENLRETTASATVQTLAEIKKLRQDLTSLASDGSTSDGENQETASIPGQLSKIKAIVIAKTLDAEQANRRVMDLEGRLQSIKSDLGPARRDFNTAASRLRDSERRGVPDETLKELRNAEEVARRRVFILESTEKQLQDSKPKREQERLDACKAFYAAADQLARAEGTVSPVPASCGSASGGPKANEESGGQDNSIEKKIERRRTEYIEWTRRLPNFRSMHDIHDLPKEGPDKLPEWMKFGSDQRSADELLYMIKDMDFETVPPMPVVFYDGKNLADAKFKDPYVTEVQKGYVDVSKTILEQDREEAHRMHWVAVFKTFSFILMAVMIPMVALIYKMTSGKDLRAYFSARHQAMRGHPQALEAETARQMIDREEEKKQRLKKERRKGKTGD